jgi:hypothetical protein
MMKEDLGMALGLGFRLQGFGMAIKYRSKRIQHLPPRT